MNCVIENEHRCSGECVEHLCVIDKPVKLRDIKLEVHEECDVEVVDKRGIDSGQKVLQILINAFEPKFGESGEDKACERVQKSAGRVGARLRGMESKIKGFESVHRCQGSGHRVRWKVPRIGNVQKGESDETIDG